MHGRSYALRVNITQSNEELLQAIKEKYGASYLYPKKQRRLNERQVFEVGWYGKTARTILEVLSGRVIAKAAQVELGLQFLDTIVPNGDRYQTRHVLNTSTELKREALRQQMRILNHAGPNKPASNSVEQTDVIQ